MTKLLFLTPELPWPPYSGGRIKSSKLIEYLGRMYRVDVGCLLKGNDREHLEPFRAMEFADRVFTEPVHVPRSAANLLRSIRRRVPLNVLRTHSQSFRDRIHEIIDDYDAVFVDHYEMMQYVPDSFAGPVVLHQHNAYHVLWETYARNGHGAARRIAAWLEAARVKSYEVKVCNRADLVFAAPNDMEMLHQAGVIAGKLAPTMHIGDDRQLHLPQLRWHKTKQALLYVGHLRWEPNVQGLIWFLEKSWPVLKGRFPGIEFNIIGADPHPRLVEYAERDGQVKLRGFQQSLEPWIQSSRVFVAPLLMGSGTKVKVINAVTRGIPTVTTTVGAEGLGLEHLSELAIAENAADMTAFTTRLLSEQHLWERLALRSRQAASRKFTWSRVFGAMRAELEILLPAADASDVKEAA